MKNSSTRWMMVASLAVVGMALTVNVGCSSDNGTPTDAGTGTGGKGDAGAGGKTGDSGTDVPVVHLVNYTFDSSIQGWALNTYADTTSRNLAGIYPTDGGVDGAAGDAAAAVDAGALPGAPTLTFDSAVGAPAPGSLKITVTFTDCGQYVDPVINLPAAQDLSNKVLHARLQITDGLFSGGAQLHASTGTGFDGYAYAPVVLAANGVFAEAALGLGLPQVPPINPAVVVQIGLQIFSGSGCTTAMPYPNAGVPVTFNIDTVTD